MTSLVIETAGDGWDMLAYTDKLDWLVCQYVIPAYSELSFLTTSAVRLH